MAHDVDVEVLGCVAEFEGDVRGAVGDGVADADDSGEGGDDDPAVFVCELVPSWLLGGFVFLLYGLRVVYRTNSG